MYKFVFRTPKDIRNPEIRTYPLQIDEIEINEGESVKVFRSDVQTLFEPSDPTVIKPRDEFFLREFKDFVEKDIDDENKLLDFQNEYGLITSPCRQPKHYGCPECDTTHATAAEAIGIEHSRAAWQKLTGGHSHIAATRNYYHVAAVDEIVATARVVHDIITDLVTAQTLMQNGKYEIATTAADIEKCNYVSSVIDAYLPFIGILDDEHIDREVPFSVAMLAQLAAALNDSAFAGFHVCENPDCNRLFQFQRKNNYHGVEKPPDSRRPNCGYCSDTCYEHNNARKKRKRKLEANQK